MDTEARNGSLGPIIGTIVVLAVIILGALYFWNERSKTDADDTSATAQNTSTVSADAIDSQSSSDDLDSIETDLNNTDTTNVGADLESM
jgi:hypothetical protein